MRTTRSPRPSHPRRTYARRVAALLCLAALIALSAAPDALAQERRAYSLDALERRFLEETGRFQEASAQAAVVQARLDALRYDYGLNLSGNFTYYPVDGPTSGDEREISSRSALDLEWELLGGGGLLQRQWERERLSEVADAYSLTAGQGRRDDLYTFRMLAVEAMRAASLARGESAAAALAGEVVDRYEQLFADGDVVRSAVVDVQTVQDAYLRNEARYRAQQLMLMRNVGILVGLDEVAVLPLAGLPPEPNWAALQRDALRLARTQQLIQYAGYSAPSILQDTELAAFVGYFFTDGERVDPADPASGGNFGDQGLRVGVRAEIPLTLFTKLGATAREAQALRLQRTVGLRAAQNEALQTLTRAMVSYNDAFDELARFESEVAQIDATLNENEAILQEGLRGSSVTPLSQALLRAERAVLQAQIDAMRYDIWGQFFRIQSLASMR
jgi:hypothetical protein